MEQEKDKQEQKKRKKEHRIVLSLNDEDYEQFLKILFLNKKTAQRFLYDRVFKDKIEDTEKYKLLAHQIRKLGVVLNQYLKLIRRGETVQDEEILTALLKVIPTLSNFLEEERRGRSGGNI